jgi:hypothetical protein
VDRRKIRVGLKVIHRHRVGDKVFRRVSELVYVRGQPRALLGWINSAGVRTPLFICELDPTRLRPAEGVKNTFLYDEETVDPRFEPLLPQGSAPAQPGA